MKKITLALCVLFSSVVFAQDGLPDTTFGTNGYVLLNTDNGVTLDRQVQPDGTTIYIDNNKFRRLTANGTPDLSFGVNGTISITQPVVNYQGFMVTGNQITLIGKGTYDNYNMGRYNFDGTVDSTLGTTGQGFVWLDLGSDIRGNVKPAQSPDGKILIGGNSSTAYGSYNNYYIRRHNLDGTHDSSYNFNAYSLGINISQTSIGYYTEEFSSGLKVRPDGNAVIYGYSNYYESSSSFVSNRKATAAIVAPTGQPIRLQHSYTAYYGWKYDLAFDQDNNTYMLGGQTTNYNAVPTPITSIKKFTASGGNANSFGTSGTLTVSLDIDATTKADFRRILIQPDGRILLAGIAVKNDTSGDNPYLVVARFLQNGTIDTTFGTNGYILHDIDHPNTPANRNALSQFYASADYSSIFVGGYNQQNAIILKYSNASMAPLTVPAFAPIAAICAGDTTPSLSATSTNGVSGTWSPAVISNTASATYTFTPNAGQHATTATLSVTVNQPTTSSVAETVCETYTWAANGNTYTESGAYTNVTTNANGCTHTETLNLTINQPTTSSVTESACETFTWAANGNTYTQSGAYTNVTTNANGCIHTETLNLTINQPTTSSVTESACETFTWAANGNTYTQSGAYTNVTTNANGCTHTETLNLTINQPTTSSVAETACDSYTWSANGNTYTDSGAYSIITTNAAGCTHTTTLNLTVNHAAEITGDAAQSFVVGSTLADVVLNTNVVWYANLADASVPENPIATSTALLDGTTYYAVNFSAQGCPSTPFAVTVSTFLGNHGFNSAQFGLYPNPTFDVINVKYASAINNVSIIDVLGQQLLTKNINGNQGQIDLSHLNAGTYFVKVTSGDATQTFKVIKK